MEVSFIESCFVVLEMWLGLVGLDVEPAEAVVELGVIVAVVEQQLGPELLLVVERIEALVARIEVAVVHIEVVVELYLFELVGQLVEQIEWLVVVVVDFVVS
ncbi:hypothetical protein J2S09_004345 [Bacillus fengqiuensis]|nr:hypothetical protein [Bacillus fengqiuensis]